MIKNSFKLIILLGAVLYRPCVIANCKFKIQNVQYYHIHETPYKISLEIENVCSTDSLNKRDIKNIKMHLHEGNKLIKTFMFEEGSWWPGRPRFFLKNKIAFNKGCLRGVRSLNLHLEDGFINSLQGIYFNLNSGKSLKFNCI